LSKEVDVSPQTVPQTEQRTVALAEIHVEQGFNPRDRFERKPLDELAKSIAVHGLLQPIVVAEDGDGYRLIAGERRYRAAELAGLEQVPVVVRQPDEGASGFELAIVENIAREQLDPLEEAKAYRRLMDEQGLTRKGVAERIGVAQRRVTDRLQILELPDELQPKLAAGEIPPAAVKPLVQLAKLHPELPAVAVAEVKREVDPDGWEEPVTWRDLVADPIAVVTAPVGGELPSDVYQSSGHYPVERFSLTEKARKDLEKLAKLGQRISQLQFGRQEQQQADALGALHGSLLIGQDVADQLACDRIARALKDARAQQRQQREWERRRAEQAKANGDGPDADGDSEEQPAPSEEELAERRRREREAQQEAKRKAAAHNAELGAAVVKGFARVKLDERVVKLLATLNLGGELEQIAMRGARYGFPGWVEQTQTKGGKPKTVYIERRGDAGRQAREYLSVAKTAQEAAGRLLALVAMARYADEAAVAQSARSYYQLPVPAGLPWSGEIVDLIDELAAERLPDHLTATKRAERAEQRQREAEREALRRSIADRIARGGELDADERAQLREEVEQAYDYWSPAARELKEQLDELDRQAADAADGDRPAEAEEVAEP
jgi:ParB/RepB/Spo0J family partition protein